MAGLPAARSIDMCSGHTGANPRPPIGPGSMTVFINNLPAIRMGDAWQTHGVPPHGGVQAGGSMTVFIEGAAAARVTDPISCGSIVATGSMDTLIG